MKKAIGFTLITFLLIPIFSVDAAGLADRLKGKILLQVEQNGEAWYVSSSDGKPYFMGRPVDAFYVMKNLGIGISNNNLNKIPLAEANLGGADIDEDGLSDMLEDSFGTDKESPDSDSDSYQDLTEVLNGYSPLGTGRLPIDTGFAESQKGKILLQVEQNGEAWYINPDDSKRYFLGRPTDAFSVMRGLGLGVTDDNFQEVSEASQPPVFPINIITSAADSKTTISWDQVENASSYSCYWANSSGVTKVSGNKIENVTSPYVHKNLTNGTVYYYVLTTVNENGESNESNEVTARPTASTALDTDGDGLTDQEENDTHGTNPNLKDTDSDGIEDKTEIDNGSDPLENEVVKTDAGTWYGINIARLVEIINTNTIAEKALASYTKINFRVYDEVKVEYIELKVQLENSKVVLIEDGQYSDQDFTVTIPLDDLINILNNARIITPQNILQFAIAAKITPPAIMFELIKNILQK